MPVSVESSVSGPYTPNGVTTAFPFAFKADSASEVIVVDEDGAALSSALYSVTLNATEGGTVTFSDAPKVADYAALYVVSDPAMTQASDFGNSGPSFNPASLTRALDRAAIRDLALQAQIDRAIKVPFGSVGTELPNGREGMFLSFNAQGDPVASSGTGADAGLRTDLAGNSGGGLIGWLRNVAGAVKLLFTDLTIPRFSVLEMIPRNLHAGIRDGTNTTDLTSYLVAGLTARQANSRKLRLEWPSGYYRFSSRPHRGFDDLYDYPLGDVHLQGIGGTFMLGDNLLTTSGHLEQFTRRWRFGGPSGRFWVAPVGGAVYTQALVLLQNIVDFTLQDSAFSGTIGNGTGDRVIIDADLSFVGRIVNCDIGYAGAPVIGTGTAAAPQFGSYGVRLGSDNSNIIKIEGNRFVGGGATVAGVVGIKAEGQSLTIADNDISAIGTAIQLRAARASILSNNYCEAVTTGIETVFLSHGFVVEGGYYDIQANGTALKLTNAHHPNVIGGRYRFTGVGTKFIDYGTECYAPNIMGVSFDPAALPVAYEAGTFQGEGALPGLAYHRFAAGAITFAGAPVARTDPNTIDCYKEQTLTNFGIKAGATAQTTTSSVAVDKTGRGVEMGGHVLMTAAVAGTGDLTITGAPYAAAGTPAVNISLSGVSYVGTPSARLNGSVIELFQTSEAGVRTALTDANLSATSRIDFNVVYAATA